MSDIRGLIIQSRLEYLENSGKYDQIMEKLLVQQRQAIGEQVFLTNLYPFQLLKDLDRILSETFDEPLETLFRDIGEKSADLFLDRYFYNYIQNRDPHGFLVQFERLYPFICGFGSYTYEKENQQSAIVKLAYDEDIHKTYCWFIQSLLKGGVEICGGKSVSILETQCEAENSPFCQYQISWSKA